jgi:hypothetical protein
MKFNKKNVSILFDFADNINLFTSTTTIFLLKFTTYTGTCINDRFKNGSITV